MKINKSLILKPVIKLLCLLLIIPILVLIHFFAFPQQTRAILVDYSGLTKKGRLYFNPDIAPETIQKVESTILHADSKLKKFWGNLTSEPKIIYCDNDSDFKKFGNPFPVPAVTMVKLGTYIVISKSGVDSDIIAHEMSHAEFYQRVGFYNTTFKVPAWFDEGLAMQVDQRSYYSEAVLKKKSADLKNLPDITKLFTGQQFGSGNLDQIMLNYMTARYIVKNWYTREKLTKLINNLNNGIAFISAYQ